MKKLALLFISVLTLATTSCGDDNEITAAELVGKWEYSQQGTVIAGQEVLTVYNHEAGCTKDFIQISSTTIVDHTFTTSECLENTTTRAYTRSGNTVSSTIQGQTVNAEIINLTATSLKLKTTQVVQGQNLSYVIVYTRV